MFDVIENVKIFIPTKGRADKQLTYNVLKGIGLKPILVVEQQEENKYKDFFHITLPENNMGIAYSRNYIVEYSRNKKFEYIVQIDDDLNSFYKKNTSGKLEKDNNAFLIALERFVDEKCYCGLEFRQFAWCKNEKYTFNHSIQACLMMYLPEIPVEIKFDKYSKEDKDFAIQLLMAGKKIIKMNDIAFSTPVVGTNKGGLHDWYENEGDKKASEYMLKKWGNNIIEIKNKYGRTDVVIKWKNIKSDDFGEFALF